MEFFQFEFDITILVEANSYEGAYEKIAPLIKLAAEIDDEGAPNVELVGAYRENI